MCAAIAGSFCAVSATLADTVNLSYTGTGAGRNVKVILNGTGSNVFAGQLRHSFAGGTGAASGLSGILTTFCADLTEFTSTRWGAYEVKPIGSMPVSSGAGAMGAERAQAIYDLYGAAGGAQLGANADVAAAFQIALWEVVYDFNAAVGRSSLDVAGGSLRAQTTSGGTLNNSILTWLNSFFDSIVVNNVSQVGLVGLAAQGRQDQVVMIPFPAAAWIGFAGLAGVGILHSARRRVR